MERLSEIVTDIYQKYSPVFKKLNVSLNLDFPDTTIEILDGRRIHRDMDKTMKSAAARTRKGHVNIAVRPGKIVISDTGTALSKSACNLLSNEHVKVKSRVGFGTEVTIS